MREVDTYVYARSKGVNKQEALELAHYQAGVLESLCDRAAILHMLRHWDQVSNVEDGFGACYSVDIDDDIIIQSQYSDEVTMFTFDEDGDLEDVCHVTEHRSLEGRFHDLLKEAGWTHMPAGVSMSEGQYRSHSMGGLRLGTSIEGKNIRVMFDNNTIKFAPLD